LLRLIVEIQGIRLATISGPWQGPRIFIIFFLPVKPSKKSRTCRKDRSYIKLRVIWRMKSLAF